jgi:hypothetical protein
MNEKLSSLTVNRMRRVQLKSTAHRIMEGLVRQRTGSGIDWET